LQCPQKRTWSFGKKSAEIDPEGQKKIGEIKDEIQVLENELGVLREQIEKEKDLVHSGRKEELRKLAIEEVLKQNEAVAKKKAEDAEKLRLKAERGKAKKAADAAAAKARVKPATAK